MSVTGRLRVLLLLPVLSCVLSCSAPSVRFGRALGVVCSVSLYGRGGAECCDEIFARLAGIDAEFDFRDEGSDVSRVNERAFGEAVVVGDDVLAVLDMARRVSVLTGGAFDVSVGALVSLWQVGSDSPRIPSESELSGLLPLVDFRNIVLDYEEKSVRFLMAGMKIDFGGIAKGFAADEIVRICARHGIRRAVIDLGGNVYVYGSKKDGSLWSVGIKNPEMPGSSPLLRISLPQNSVVTSGVYERFFDEGGERYHHILSPKTGRPVESGLASVSVICTNSMLADALATGFFVLGTDESLRLLPSLRQEFGIEISAVFIDRSHIITLSDNFPFDYEILHDGWSVQ